MNNYFELQKVAKSYKQLQQVTNELRTSYKQLQKVTKSYERVTKQLRTVTKSYKKLQTSYETRFVGVMFRNLGKWPPYKGPQTTQDKIPLSCQWPFQKL